MEIADAPQEAATARGPDWLPVLVELLAESARGEVVPAVAAATALESAEVRRRIARLGAAGGLTAVHDFVDATLADPVGVVIAVQQQLGRTLADEERDRFEAQTLALALAIVRTARMRSRWSAVFQLGYHRGEQDVAGMARLLAEIADPRESGRLLIRRLRSRDDDEREYAIYLLAEYVNEPFFGGWLPRLREKAEAEAVDWVKAAWDALFERAAR